MKACLIPPCYGSLPRWLPVFPEAARILTASTCMVMTAACREPSRLPLVIPTTPSETIYSLAVTVTETEPTTSTRVRTRS